jgi:hypothetical protein
MNALFKARFGELPVFFQKELWLIGITVGTMLVDSFDCGRSTRMSCASECGWITDLLETLYGCWWYGET